MDDLVALTPKDPERGFTDRDKERVFYRDNQQCQHCAMSNETHRVDFDNAEIHHVTPHHQGGMTSIENGALVHKDCHPNNKHFYHYLMHKKRFLLKKLLLYFYLKEYFLNYQV